MMGVSALFVVMMASASGAADDLAVLRHPPVQLEVPASWKGKVSEDSVRYTAPSGDAYFLLDVGQTARPMSGEECREKILASMKAEKPGKLNIGGAPAARMTAVDRSKEDKEEVHTATYVGCDGKSTWSLVFHYIGKKKARYAPLAEKIAKSVRYLSAEDE